MSKRGRVLRGAVVPGSRWEYEPVYGQEPLRVTVQESEKVELLDSRGEPIILRRRIGFGGYLDG